MRNWRDNSGWDNDSMKVEVFNKVFLQAYWSGPEKK